MRFGAFVFATDRSIHPTELGRALEDHGFESLWVPEHTHIPVSRLSPYPAGGDLPDHYRRSLDPFVALAMAAAVTTRLRLATGVCLVVERDPIVLAKEVATLDWASGGRVLFGVGAGWNREEMGNHGTDPRTRRRLMRERVLAMKQLWTAEEAEFHGRFVDFDPVWQWPKPIQRPHPPVLVGGDGPSTFDHVVEYGDGWVPILRPGQPPFGERMAQLRRSCEEAGREPVPVTAFLWNRPSPADLEELQGLGVERVVVPLPPVDRDRVLPRVEGYGELARRFA
ncbi:MAG TPA: LLM class F420-dependent oxidoreductase [Candidatus Dormibacteraeota bacterium]|nr:LLM class F420-dependent oxidoreductase [Candidatus Dormibacteraeota bacterium]